MADRTHKRSPVVFALFGRCPRCGRGRLFTGYLEVAGGCDICGLGYSGHDAADGPAVLIIMLLGFLVVGLVFLVEAAYHPPLWIHAVIWPPFVLGAALGALRPLKALFIGLQFKYRAVEDEFPDEEAEG